MHWPKKSEPLTGILLAILLTAYAEMRLSIPTYDGDFINMLDQEPTPLLAWVNLLDARMTGACTSGFPTL